MDKRPLTRQHVNDKVDSTTKEWEPWDRYFPGAPPIVDGEYGGWVKVLRSPQNEETGWTFLFKWVGHPTTKTRLKAIVPEHGEEHVYTLHGYDANRLFMEGIYTYRGPGALHSDVFGESFIAFLKYTDAPDTILSYDVIDK